MKNLFEGKVGKFFELARKEANKSSCSFRHGAVLAKGNKLIRSACNENRYCCFADHHRQEPGHGTLHAEIAVVVGVDRKITLNKDVYVVRVNSSNDFMNSKPCQMCQTVMAHVGIKKVYYSIDNYTYGVMKLN